MSNSSSANTRQSNSEADKYAARKTDLKAAQTKLDTESDKLLKAERANVKEEEALNTHLQEVSTRTPVQKFVHRSKALVQGDIHGEWEGLDAIARTHNLEDAKKDALEQREKVVEAHKEVDKANRAMLNKEDHFLENEIKAEKVKLDSLADKKIRATGRNERIVDKKISRSKAKIKELEEKTVANETAAKQAKTAKNQETAKTNQKCTNDICTTTAIETKCQHSDKGRMAQIPPGGTMKELHVISCGANGKISEADIISIGQEGSCQKGLTVSSSLSSASQVDNRVEKDQHCPYLTVSGPSDRNFNICLPGPASNPL
ncbi:MAG: hypothetical protein HRU20_31090, partial [Pseudomonadales bacterium]|nr:hypothetical protein [Pseudomonadales bacterium]